MSGRPRKRTSHLALDGCRIATISVQFFCWGRVRGVPTSCQTPVPTAGRSLAAIGVVGCLPPGRSPQEHDLAGAQLLFRLRLHRPSVNASGDLGMLGGVQSEGRCLATSLRFAAAWATARSITPPCSAFLSTPTIRVHRQMWPACRRRRAVLAWKLMS